MKTFIYLILWLGFDEISIPAILVLYMHSRDKWLSTETESIGVSIRGGTLLSYPSLAATGGDLCYSIYICFEKILKKKGKSKMNITVVMNLFFLVFIFCSY